MNLLNTRMHRREPIWGRTGNENKGFSKVRSDKTCEVDREVGKLSTNGDHKQNQIGARVSLGSHWKWNLNLGFKEKLMNKCSV